MSHPATITGIEATARWAAAVRARESAREDRLFDDPWADALAGDDGRAWIEARLPDSVTPMVLRTRYFDDWLLRLTTGQGIRQVVDLAAGLDTRAFRMAWPEATRLFELDRPAVLRHKATILGAGGATPRCDRIVIEEDLAGEWAGPLLAAGFDGRRPAVWLLEGILFYLPGEAITRVLDEVTRLSVRGSHLGFDIVNGAILTSAWTRPWVEMQTAAGAPWIGTMEDPVGFLAERGWRASLSQAGQPDANHGRWTLPVLPTTMPDFPHNWFVTAERTG
jgi:methyltransferase (TIGR00027 family)